MQANSKERRTGPNPAKETVAGKDSFEAVAKRLECDEDTARFESKLGKLAKVKPAPKANSKR
jgi:hypothetical protein